MKKLLVNLILGAVLTGCTDNRPTLHVFNWSDYISQDVITQFEQEYNCKIVLDSFDDNETMLAKLLAGGASGYDVIFPSSYIVPVMVRQKLIRRLDMSLLPNVITNLDTKYALTFGPDVLKYSVPYGFSMTGIAYRSDKIDPSQVTNSWEFLKHPAFAGRVSLLHDIREMIGVGLKMTRHSINSEKQSDIDEALEYITTLKKIARKLDNQMYRVSLASGDFYVCIGYNSDVLQIIDENPEIPIEFMIPDEGSMCCWDEMVISSKAPQPELAHKFINFLYDPKIAAQNAPQVDTCMPNKGMIEFLDEECATNELMVIREEVLRKLEPVLDLPNEVRQMYDAAWDVFTTKTVN